MKLIKYISVATLAMTLGATTLSAKKSTSAFPAIIPVEKPTDRPLSAAMERLYDTWGVYEDRTNELFSNFKYSPLVGFEQREGISRRDPTKIIKVDGLYYVYYTYRNTESNPVGYKGATDKIPSFDWDLADIYYATSKDGVVWEEQGAAVVRPSKGEYGWRSVTTPGILVYKGKYYIYFQAFNEAPGGAKGDSADVRVAVSDSPRGPFKISDREIIPYGKEGEWDGYAIHDPCPIIYKGRIMLFYKGQGSDRSKYDVSLNIGGGVAYSTDPLGPFEKSPLNPVLNSGHETCVFPFKGGIAAIVSLNGPEKNTVQFAADGENFEIASHIIMPPIAPAPYSPDAFADTDNGVGIRWGLCHVSRTKSGALSSNELMRFDCDLSLEVDDKAYKAHNVRFNAASYLDPATALAPQKKQEEKKSEAMKRFKCNDSDNELYTRFRYKPVKGLGYEEGVHRRDPSSIIKVDDLYYVWYTRTTDEQYTWLNADIWYATSPDGETWTEQGAAVTRGKRGSWDDYSVFTTNILVAEGKYYLVYQAREFAKPLNVAGMAWADSPKGPWTKLPDPVLCPTPDGKLKEYKGYGTSNYLIGNTLEAGSWDSGAIHDPGITKFRGKYYLYYKSHAIGDKMHADSKIGLAIADKPEGPYVKSEYNPVLNSGHEVWMFPWRKGIAAVVDWAGPEKGTIQYSEDGINFQVASSVEAIPPAGGAYIADKFTDSGDGQGFTWGLCHYGRSKWAFLVRFDCDLHRDSQKRIDWSQFYHYSRIHDVDLNPEKFGVTTELLLRKNR